MKPRRARKHRLRGFSLIEVMISILVFSFGLLGIAGMMTVSIKTNHNGYMRTQANVLADNMADRMRINPTGLWQDAYTGVAVTGSLECSLGEPCDYAQLAAFDMQQWAFMIDRTLPNAQGEIQCQANSELPAGLIPADLPSIWFPSPPYDGVCEISIVWSEADAQSSETTQRVQLLVQP